jgi:Chaperone of endosialidase
MYPSGKKKGTMNRMIQLKQTTPVFLVVLLLCFGVLQGVQAVVPPPDGGYPGGNTAEGQNALFSLTTGTFNTAVGFFSLRSNTEGQFNTGIGAGTLLANTSFQNTATGTGALLSNTTGFNNTANGAFALLSNTIGSNNTATGAFALYGNTTGGSNTATGQAALSNNTFGNSNTAIGASALFNNTTGQSNTVLGFLAGGSVTDASNVICIGDQVGGANVSNTTWIGNVYGVTTQNFQTASVIVSADGQLGTVASSKRFKKDIATMQEASEAILSLRPVTFHYKTDTKGTPQFGLIAEEVAKVNAALVLPDKEGRPYTVRYDAVNAMLLNEFLKEHRKNEKQEATIAELKAEIATLAGTVKEQTAQMEKVSAQLTAASLAMNGIRRD